jgi:hypothetical protein
MPIITISIQELKKGKTLDEGWYKGTLKKFEVSLSKDKKSVNYIPTIVIDDKTPEGREMQTWFNSGWIAKLVPFYVAVTGKTVNDDVPLQIDTDDFKSGTEIWCHIVIDVYNGSPNNKLDNFLPGDVEVPF